jgi:hypothetical protein
MKLPVSQLLIWGYRILFALTTVGLILTAYLLFGWLTSGKYGFNSHPFLDNSNFGIGLAALVMSPFMVANFVAHLFCWVIYWWRNYRKPNPQGPAA